MDTIQLICRRIMLAAISIGLLNQLNAQTTWQHGRLKVSPDGYYLQYQDGTPFFWLGDTGWELFHRLTLEEIKLYMDNRAAKGFNVIQAVALSGEDLTKPNQYGEAPLKNNDPASPNEKYFTVIDSTMRLALRYHMFIGLLPTWGDKVIASPGTGPAFFDSAKAYAFGNGWATGTRIIPISSGYSGAITPRRRRQSITGPYGLPWRTVSSKPPTSNALSLTTPEAAPILLRNGCKQAPWLDLNMFQSSHGSGHDVACWELVKRDRGYSPAKPTLDGEPNYEDHPVNPWPKWNPDNGYFRAYDVRKQMYRSVFAGACGVTYGHHAVWQFVSAREEVLNYADRGWLLAIDRPGAYQAGYLRRLIESRPMEQRIPDSSIIAQGQGTKGEHMEAFSGADGSYAMVYLPVGKEIGINTACMKAGKIVAWWFNPKDARVIKIATMNRTPLMHFTAPVTGVENDWVLVLDDAAKQYKEPGK